MKHEYDFTTYETLAQLIKHVRADWKKSAAELAEVSKLRAIENAQRLVDDARADLDDAKAAAAAAAAAIDTKISSLRAIGFTNLTPAQRGEMTALYTQRAQALAASTDAQRQALAAAEKALERAIAGKVSGNTTNGGRTSNMPDIGATDVFARRTKDHGRLIVVRQPDATWNVYLPSGNLLVKSDGASYSTINSDISTAIGGGASPGMGGIAVATQADLASAIEFSK